MRKVILIIIILVIFAFVAVGGYFLWQYFTGGAPAVTPTGTASPIAVGGTPSPILTTSPTVLPEGPLMAWGGPALAGYYLKNGTAISLGTNGQVVSIRGKGMVPLNNSTINETLLGITPSFDGRWFLEKWGSNNSPRFSLFDTQNNNWTTFADLYFADMDFSPKESKVAYLEDAAGKVNLGIMDLSKPTKDGFSRTTIDSFALQDAGISWISPDIILFHDKPSVRVPGSVWRYTISAKRLDPLITNVPGLWISWDKTASSGIKFVGKPQSSLEVINLKGEIVYTSPFLTFPDKCALAGKALYCAVPQTPPRDDNLPDAYLKRSFYTNDNIYEMDLASKQQTLIFANSPVKLDIIDLRVDGQKMYFINRYDQKLYQLSF